MSSPQNSYKTQLVIIGAGPTGLSLAVQLLRYQVDFIIIEKNNGLTNLSKALVVQARTLEIFQELGLAEKAIHEGRITTGLNLFYKGKRIASVNIKGLGEGISPFPYALSLEQSKTEKLLADYLAEHNKTIKCGCELTALEQNDSGITVSIKNNKGEEEKIAANYLAGCDGAGSQVRHMLGLPLKGSTQPKLFYVADVILQSDVINRDEIYMFMIKRGFVLFFPMEGAGHYRIIGVLPDAKNPDEKFAFDDIQPIIQNNIITPVDIKELRWFSSYKVHSRKADTFQKGRCFMVGDAAHIHTPAGGQGMNTGIQDAYNLAWKIAYRLEGELNDRTLETYDTERSHNARHLLTTTDRMFDIMSGANAFWNFVRLTFFPPLFGSVTRSEFVRKKLFPLISQTGIAYPDSYLTIQSSLGKVRAGERMHYFVFANGKDIFSFISEPVFKLLFFGKSSAHQNFDKTKIIVKIYTFNEIPKTLFGNETEFFILLRPDNHISYIGKSIEKCLELIRKISE